MEGFFVCNKFVHLFVTNNHFMNLKLEDLNTSKCLIDPKRADLINATKHWSEFADKDFAKVSLKGVIRYIILMYDCGSPLWKEIRDLPIRKAVAMDMAGISREKNGKFPRLVEIMMEGGNPTVNAMIVKYISMQNNPIWSNRVAFETIYYMELGKILSGQYEKTNDVIKAIDQLSSFIISLTDKLVGGVGEVQPILDLIYRETAKDLDITVEKIADYIMDGGNVPESWNPYSNGDEMYSPEKSKFIGDN